MRNSLITIAHFLNVRSFNWSKSYEKLSVENHQPQEEFRRRKINLYYITLRLRATAYTYRYSTP